MNILVNIYGDENQLTSITSALDGGGIDHSEIHDNVTASSKLNNPLSNPDLLIEVLKFATAAVQTTGAVIVLYTAIKQALKPGKKIILVKDSGEATLEINENTTEEDFHKFMD